jgi:hypothetical protein
MFATPFVAKKVRIIIKKEDCTSNWRHGRLDFYVCERAPAVTGRG